MTALSTFRYPIVLYFLVLYFITLTADSKTSFYFKNFTKDSNFESQLALYGDTKVVNGGLSLQITGSSVFSAGRVMYKKPVKLLEEKPRSLVSFSTYFSFSMSPQNGDGLAFFIVPVDYPVSLFDGGSFGLLSETKLRFLAIEFDTSKDPNYSDVNGNHVGIDVSSFVYVKVSNVSSVNLVLNNGEKLQTWIDYEGSSKRLEIRLSKLGHMKPIEPSLSYSIDMSQMWKDDEVFVGLSSSNGNSSQKCNVLSWSFKLRQAPQRMHSNPLDPQVFVGDIKRPTVHKRSNCFPKVLVALIIGIVCGTLGTFIVLFMWTIFRVNKRSIVPVVPEAYVADPAEFEYKKYKVADEDIEDCKK